MIGATETMILSLVILINVSTCIASHINTPASADKTTNGVTETLSSVKDAESSTPTRKMSTSTSTANTYSPSFPTETPESTTLPSTIILDSDALLIRIDLNVSIGKPFSPELTNQSSPEYKITSDAFLQSLTTAFETMPSYSGITIEQFRNGSTVCDFGLLLDGNVNLTSSEEAFDRSLKYLENVTVFGNLVEFQSADMKAAFSQASSKQTTGDVCEVYVDIIYCKWGYTCQRTSNGTTICTLDCSSLSTSCFNNGGTCVFDRKNNQSICLCTVDACWNDGQSLNKETIVGIVFGVISTVLTAIPIGFKIYKCCKKTKQQKYKVTKNHLPDGIKDDDKGERTSETPMIYMCATLWHESENEMTQLLKSIFRMDEDQCTRKYAQFLIDRRDPDYYEFEAHIFFDDAFEGHKDDEYNFTVNEYVKLLLKTVKVSASSVHGVSYNINPPVKIATPYGGRLVWTLPGGNKLITHLKDKAFIRNRKRWSQVMYINYFLGYELKKQLQKRAENTFLLASDGDVDFHPQAVQLLVDEMRKNPDVGAACGRIHPIGKGVMVWYQKFEYAVSHWLQKAAEDTFGCVLFSPGCFSLFRGSSLRDVMAKYTTPPTEPRHYVQYDQGGDRWLCTLLLQQGHRVEYCAASDVLTHAPEGFYEFFNQRRRWTPSTMANILDLLTHWKNLTKKNAEITFAYVLYQGLLMVSSILTPGTIFLMILGAINLAYPEVELWVALVINALPVAIMVFLCFKEESDTQLTYAAILSTAYSLIMMIVIVGLLRQAAMYGMCSVTTVFLLFVAGVFVLAAFLHPQEFWCIIHGFLYFLAIPSMSMILMIYALGNLHAVSWGTRENKTAAKQQDDKKDSNVSGFLSMFSGCCPWRNTVTQREDDKLRAILDRLDGVESGLRDFSTLGSNSSFGNQSFGSSLSSRSGSPVMMGIEEPAIRLTDMVRMFSGASNKANPIFAEAKQQHRDRMVNLYWCEKDPDIRVLQPDIISTDETQFWRELIEKYLKPLDADKNKEKEVQAQLIELRNKVFLIFILINSLFIIIVFSLQQVFSSDGSLSIKLPCPDSESNTGNKGDTIEPISVAFILVFGIPLLVQFICMLMHRMTTLLHIFASTEIFKKMRKNKMPGMSTEEGRAVKAEISYEQVYELVRDMQNDHDADTASLTSESSFGGQSEADGEEAAENRRKTQRERWKKQRRRINNRTLEANFMRNLERIQSVMRDSNRPEGDGGNEITEGDEIKAWKKKTHFNRMRNKSIHVIAMMAKDPKMKENISRKQIIREQIIKEKKRENYARQDLKGVIEAESPALSRRNVDVHAEDTEQNDDDMFEKFNDVRDESDSDKERESPNESENEDEEEHGATFQLDIPKVNDDQWPDEDNYAQVMDKIDVLF